jgi:hypothetical protein
VVPKPTLRRWLHAGGRLACLGAAWVVLFAAAIKLVDVPTFVATLAQHHPRAEGRLEPLAILLAAGEAAAGAWALALVLGKNWPRAALLLAAVFLAFALYAAWLTAHPPPKPAPCGCGFSNRPIAPDEWSATTLRNAGIAATCALLALAGGARGGERA